MVLHHLLGMLDRGKCHMLVASGSRFGQKSRNMWDRDDDSTRGNQNSVGLQI